MSAKPSRTTKPTRSPTKPPAQNVARTGRNVLRSSTVGALPILNHFLRRMRLEDFLRAALPAEDRRIKLSPVKALLVLLRNLLISREPIYGVGEWAARHVPNLLGLAAEKEIGLLNDDCVGRALDRLFLADVPSLVLAVATHVVKEFGVSLDELHNDSTTVTFCGAYANATADQRALGRPTLAIAFGHNKDHRPDLKQLLVHPHGHRRRRRAAALPRGKRQRERRSDPSRHLGSALPVDRSTRLPLRGRLQAGQQREHGLSPPAPGPLRHHLAADPWRRRCLSRSWWPRDRSPGGRCGIKTDEEGEVIDRYSTSDPPATTTEGYRLIWYHSLRKAEQDAVARSGRIERALKQLAALKEKLRSPRTRYRQEAKVAAAVARRSWRLVGRRNGS